ncbi:hypothetical protein C4569_00040 [Candidatus Parcubacteria bacterium]|nr:MAG: hypothetical protein C4569_00040 [Candidatus Parcubacteria bacterium]
MSVFDFLIVLLLLPLIYQNFKFLYLKLMRNFIISRIEAKRNTKVIIMIHKKRSPFLGIFGTDKIDIENSEAILDELRSVPESKAIDIIIHTPGGFAIAAEQIALALAEHKSEITAFIPHYALSGGTLIAVAANKIVMDKNAFLGRIDPQLIGFPAASLVKAIDKKEINEISDSALVLADIAEKSIKQLTGFVVKILKIRRYDLSKIDKIATELVSGKYTHDHPLTYSEALDYGLKVNTGIPGEVYKLLKLYTSRY